MLQPLRKRSKAVLVLTKRRVALVKAVMAVSALSLGAFSLTACGGEAEQQEEAQQAQQESAQSSSPTAQSNDLGAGRGLVGTWEETETGLGGLITFSDDGTFESQPLPNDDPDLILAGEYSVDGSIITFFHPEEGETSRNEYTLEGDTLTMRVQELDPEIPIDPVSTYKRKS
jgi:hypothetical protein